MGRSFLPRIVLVAGLLGGGESLAEDPPYLSENLTAWYRADTGVETNEMGKVTAWRNLGTLGAELDTTTAVEDGEGGLVIEPVGCGGRPSVGFDGHQYLKTAAGSTLGITSSGCAWFVVFYPDQDEDVTTRVNQALFGSAGPGGGTYRFGVFYPSASGYQPGSVLGGFFYNLSTIIVGLDGFNTQLHTGACWTDPSGRWGNLMNNAYYSDLYGPLSVSPAAGVFHIGQMVTDWMLPFKGGIAELRIYNRPLTASERVRIQFELCSRYGIHWDGHGGIDPAALRWYANSSVQGPLFDCGAPEEKSLVCTNDGLTVTLAYPTADHVNDEICSYLAHDGVASVARTWYFSTHRAARRNPITFTFDRTRFGLPSAALYYKSSYGGNWTRLPYDAVVEGDTIRFDIPSDGIAKGFFRLAPREGVNLAAWFRADGGVETNGLGQISAWRNLGAMGSILDVYPTNIVTIPHITLVTNCVNGRPAASFDGEAALQSTNSSNLGFADGQGGAWFAVFKPASGVDRLDRRNRGLFGMSTVGGYRSGAFVPNYLKDSDGTSMIGYLYSCTIPLSMNLGDGWQMMEYFKWSTGSEVLARGFNDGADQGGIGTWGNAWTAPFYLGEIGLDFSKPWHGEIAEVRVYNRPLGNYDRSLVEIALGADYGISVSTAGINGVPDGSCLGDAVVFGTSSVNLGNYPVVTNATSAQLSVVFADEPTEGAAALTFVGHDDGSWFGEGNPSGPAARTWFLSTESATARYLISFDLAMQAGYDYCLYYRSARDQAWESRAKTRGVVGNNPVLEVTGLSAGYYTLCVKPACTFVIIK